ncbi:MAG TPA: hypothetical protein VFT95_01610, partial [Micromonosporaceae bacterium]|nr:hypothetical protein [Micromonosporaceae bacterium]
GSFITLGLAAPDENNDLQWKKFANNPLLEVVFSFPPNNATGLRVSNEVRCYGKVVTSDANPILYATASDNNSPPLMPALWHHVYTADETRWITSSSGGVRISSGSEGQWRIPPVDRLSDGEWKFRVYVNNNPEDPSRNLANPNNGGYSSWYPFIVRATPPRNAPGIRGDAGDYPANYWGAGAGAPGAIPVHTNFEPNVVGYTYTFLGSGTEVVPGGNDCTYNRSFGASGGWIPHSWYGQDFIPIPAGLSAGYHTVHVRSFDDAHNLSPESSHTFYVAPNTGAAARRVEAETMQLSGQGVQPQVLNNDCCAMSFSGGSFVMLPATTTGQSMTLRFSVTATGNYQLAAGLMSSYDFGQFAITLDGTPIGHPELGMPPGTFNGWTNPPTVSHRPLGTRRLAAGQHALTLTTTGTDPSSIDLRYLVAVDYLDLIPASRLEADDPAQVTVSVPQGQSAVPAPQTNCCFLVSWTQGKQLLFASNTVNGSFDLGFSVPLEADYALGAGLTKAADYGKLTLLLDGKPLQNTDVTPWDGYASSVSNQFVALGGLHLAAGAHTLTVKVVGTNPASTGDRYKAGVDYISAVPINNVTTAGFTQAMNNDGIVADTGVPADTRASLDLNGGYLSAQTLAATGYGPGAPVRIGGANFTMPTPRADGTDNVIAIGQTIPFAAAQQVAASAVGLLVTATCGSVPARTATLTYTDNTTQDTRLSAVEDWVWYVSLDPNIVTLPYRVGASGVDRTVHPGLRAVFLPADPTKTLKSITLPNYGSSLVPGSCSPALHVLAMAPRVATPGWIGAWTAPADATVPPAGGVGFANQTLRTIVHPTVT